jgi:MOSC domain-containing protein YiiM
MQLLSINIGQARTQINGKKLETTGIYKVPASGEVQITAHGIEGDFIGDQKSHGGPDQAIYVYGQTDYQWWERAQGATFAPGTFGENLTISDLESAQLRIGDRLRLGGAVLEITSPRTPCSTLATRMAIPEFVKQYRRAERPGVYCRVVQAGTVQAGDEVLLVPRNTEAVLVMDLFREHYRRDKDEEELRRMLRAPISIRARAAMEASLQKLLAGGQT